VTSLAKAVKYELGEQFPNLQKVYMISFYKKSVVWLELCWKFVGKYCFVYAYLFYAIS